MEAEPWTENPMARTKMNAVQAAYAAINAAHDSALAEFSKANAVQWSAWKDAGCPQGADGDAFYVAWANANPEVSAELDRLHGIQHRAWLDLQEATTALLEWAFRTLLRAARTAKDRENVKTIRDCEDYHIRLSSIEMAMRMPS